MPLTPRELTDLIERGSVLDEITRLELAGHSTVEQLKGLDRKQLVGLAGADAGRHTVRRALGVLLDRAVERRRTEQ